MSAYVRMMTPYAARVWAALDIPEEYTLAQWAHETAWGGSQVATFANNHAGIKFVEQAAAAGEFDGYAKYESLDRFVEDYIRVMSLPRYAAARNLARTSQDSRLYFSALQAAGYAEDPQYGGKVTAIVAEILGEIPATPPAGSTVTVPVPPGFPVPADQTGQAAAAGLMLAGGLYLILKLFR